MAKEKKQSRLQAREFDYEYPATAIEPGSGGRRTLAGIHVKAVHTIADGLIVTPRYSDNGDWQTGENGWTLTHESSGLSIIPHHVRLNPRKARMSAGVLAVVCKWTYLSDLQATLAVAGLNEMGLFDWFQEME